jgi:multidrug efflux pump subunit AcrB
MVGGLVSLMLCGTELNIFSFVGLILLVGLSQLLTLYVTPAFYVAVERMRGRAARIGQ